jgi:putative membrane protein
MNPEIQAFATGFPITLLHAGLTLVMLVLGVFLYALLSPYKEVEAIRDGNAAAAVALGGVMIGLAAPLALSLAASPSLLEIGVWGLAVVAVQLLAFRLVDLALGGLGGRIGAGDVSAAVLLTAARLSSAVILSAAVTS